MGICNNLDGFLDLLNLYISVQLLTLFPRNHPHKKGFLMISGGIEVNQFAQIRFLLKVKFGDDLLTH